MVDPLNFKQKCIGENAQALLLKYLLMNRLHFTQKTKPYRFKASALLINLARSSSVTW